MTRWQPRCRQPRRCWTAIPQCRAEWDGRGGTMQRIRQLLARSHRRHSRPHSGWPRSWRSSTRALLRFSTGANRRVGDAVGFDSTRWFDAVPRDARRLRSKLADYPGPPVHRAVRGRRRRGRDHRARRRADAPRARVARHGRRPRDEALASRAIRRNLGEASRARQSVERPARVRLHGLLRLGSPKPRCRSISSPARAASPRSCARSPRCSA